MNTQLFLIYGFLIGIPVVPWAVWKIFTLPPKTGRITDLSHTLGYYNRLNRKGVDVKLNEAYAWIPRKAERKRILALPGRIA
jgi:hypothetical protein